MTREKLYNHFALRQELAQAKETLDSLRAAVSPGAQALTGMPHGHSVTDRTGDLAAEILDMEQDIQRIEREITDEEPEILTFINTIRHGRTRVIFRLRILRGYTWKEAASVLGRYATEKSVRAVFYSYIKKHVDGGALDYYGTLWDTAETDEAEAVFMGHDEA